MTRELIKIEQRTNARNLGTSKFRASMGWCTGMFQNGGISASLRLYYHLCYIF